MAYEEPRAPFMIVEWVSAGTPEQDEALADEIADFAMNLLDGYDPAVSATLGQPDQ